MTPDIVDDIDALVDEQLAAGEPERGFDFGDPTYPRCPHCDRHWHGLPLTQRVAIMYTLKRFDEDYRAAEDTSPMVCEGSDFIGPTRPPVGPWLSDAVIDRMLNEVGAVIGIPPFLVESWGNADHTWTITVDTPRIPKDPWWRRVVVRALVFLNDRGWI